MPAIRNANIYTVDNKQPWAEAMAIKDGKLVYVGSNEGTEAFEDLVKDAHIHIAWGSKSRLNTPDMVAIGRNKAEVLASIKNSIVENPENEGKHWKSLTWKMSRGRSWSPLHI